MNNHAETLRQEAAGHAREAEWLRNAKERWQKHGNDTNQIDREIASHEAIKAACLAGAESLEREQWRPIETAPKEGTEVLVFVKGRAYYLACFDGDDWLNCEGRVVQPTHWRPLPPGPDHSGDGNGMIQPATCEECRTLEAGGWCRIEGFRLPGQAVCGSFAPMPGAEEKKEGRPCGRKGCSMEHERCEVCPLNERGARR